MARNKEGRSPVAHLKKTKDVNANPTVDKALDSIREVLEGMMAHHQILTNDLKQIKANVQFNGKDWEENTYVQILTALNTEQEESIKVLREFLAIILSGNHSKLNEFVETANKLKEGTFQRFRDFLTMKSGAYVKKYKPVEQGEDNA